MPRDNNNDYVNRGLYVEVKGGDPMKAWKKLKKKVQNEGVIQELRARQAFEKPSAVKKRKTAMAKKRWHKQERELINSGKLFKYKKNWDVY